MDSQIVYDCNDDLKSSAGVFIDIDGVVLTGGKPYDWTIEAIHTLWKNNVPFVFVTNGTYCSATLVNNLRNIIGLPFTSDHVVVAPSPCSALTQFHNKHVLACCQEDSNDLIEELGFTSFITIPQLAEIFPDLDYVDHKKRKELLKMEVTQEFLDKQANFKPIECILLLGEPVNWECHLQLILDVLMTNGDPRKKFKFVPSPHLPIIASNRDLTFKGAAALPRFGHGAFLTCLESLYKQVTQNELVYDQMMGKPFLVTYEYAANQIQRLARDGHQVNKFYIIGDNPDVDVRGANLFKEHLERKYAAKNALLSSWQHHNDAQLAQLQLNEAKSSFKQVEAILVSTGVYNPQNDLAFHLKNLFSDTENRLNKQEANELKQAMSRKNAFMSYFDNKLNIPELTVNTLLDAVQYIMKTKENLC